MSSLLRKFKDTDVYNILTKEQKDDIDFWDLTKTLWTFNWDNIISMIGLDIQYNILYPSDESYDSYDQDVIFVINRIKLYHAKIKIKEYGLNEEAYLDNYNVINDDYYLIDQFVEKTIGQLKKSVSELLPTPSCLSKIIIEYF